MTGAFQKFRRIHFVGIGGIGMSGIAEVLLTLGYTVSGSDAKASPITERLQSLGAQISEGHSAENVRGANVIVVSNAIRRDNPELVEAARLKIPVIAGAHGKTTTTSMIASVLAAGNLDPTFVVGGRVNHAGTTARLGRGDYMVVEADESDRSFLLLSPAVAVVTNIDREHLDHYASIEEIREVFTQFVNRIPFYGAAVLCLDDPNVRAILPQVHRTAITYGTSTQADLVVSEVVLNGLASNFRLTYRAQDLGLFALHGPPGLHNVRNAAAAAAVGLYLDVSPEHIHEGLSAFTGVGRRFEIKAAVNGITVIDDYGHHPAEIRATLEAARGYKRLLVLFQPHRYTRTKYLWDDFCHAFDRADLLVLADIYAASETPIAGVTSEALAAAIRATGHTQVLFRSTLQEGIDALLGAALPGDAILTIGAGNVGRAADELALLIGAPASARHAKVVNHADR